MKKYITVNLKTIKGFKKAENLKNNGWIIISIGFDTIQMMKNRGKK